MAGYVKVAKSADIAPGQSKLVEANGKKVALFNVDGSFHAIDNTCTHSGGPLSQGTVEGNFVTCPWHGAIFDVTCGKVMSGPAPSDVACYKVRVEGDDLEIEIS